MRLVALLARCMLGATLSEPEDLPVVGGAVLESDWVPGRNCGQHIGRARMAPGRALPDEIRRPKVSIFIWFYV